MILILEILDTAGIFMDAEQAGSVRLIMAEDSTDKDTMDEDKEDSAGVISGVMAEDTMDEDIMDEDKEDSAGVISGIIAEDTMATSDWAEVHAAGA